MPHESKQSVYTRSCCTAHVLYTVPGAIVPCASHFPHISSVTICSQKPPLLNTAAAMTRRRRAALPAAPGPRRRPPARSRRPEAVAGPLPRRQPTGRCAGPARRRVRGPRRLDQLARLARHGRGPPPARRAGPVAPIPGGPRRGPRAAARHPARLVQVPPVPNARPGPARPVVARPGPPGCGPRFRDGIRGRCAAPRPRRGWNPRPRDPTAKSWAGRATGSGAAGPPAE